MRRRAVLVPLLLVALAAPAAAAQQATAPEGELGGAPWRLVSASGVAVGGGRLDDADARELREAGFRAVVSERGFWADDAEVAAALAAADLDHLSLPADAPDARPFSLDDVVSVVEWIGARVSDGEPVYAHATEASHRPAAMVAAYLMVEHRVRAHEAFALVRAAAPSARLDEAAALYQLEAALFGEERLDVDLRVDQVRVEPGGAADVRAHVLHDGAPVEGARVALALESGGGAWNATSDENGVASFRYDAPDAPALEHLRATATLDGFVPGFDRVAVRSGEPRPPTLVSRVDLGTPGSLVEPGAPMRFVVQAHTDAAAARVRVTITDGCETLHRDTTGEDARAEVALAAPRTPGAYVFQVRVHHVESPPVVAEARVVVGDDRPAPACEDRLPGGPPVEVRLQAPPRASGDLLAVALPSTVAVLALLGGALVAHARVSAR